MEKKIISRFSDVKGYHPRTEVKHTERCVRCKINEKEIKFVASTVEAILKKLREKKDFSDENGKYHQLYMMIDVLDQQIFSHRKYNVF